MAGDPLKDIALDALGNIRPQDITEVTFSEANRGAGGTPFLTDDDLQGQKIGSRTFANIDPSKMVDSLRNLGKVREQAGKDKARDTEALMRSAGLGTAQALGPNIAQALTGISLQSAREANSRVQQIIDQQLPELALARREALNASKLAVAEIGVKEAEVEQRADEFNQQQRAAARNDMTRAMENASRQGITIKQAKRDYQFKIGLEAMRSGSLDDAQIQKIAETTELPVAFWEGIHTRSAEQRGREASLFRRNMQKLSIDIGNARRTAEDAERGFSQRDAISWSQQAASNEALAEQSMSQIRSIQTQLGNKEWLASASPEEIESLQDRAASAYTTAQTASAAATAWEKMSSQYGGELFKYEVPENISGAFDTPTAEPTLTENQSLAQSAAAVTQAAGGNSPVLASNSGFNAVASRMGVQLPAGSPVSVNNQATGGTPALPPIQLPGGGTAQAANNTWTNIAVGSANHAAGKIGKKHDALVAQMEQLEADRGSQTPRQQRLTDARLAQLQEEKDKLPAQLNQIAKDRDAAILQASERAAERRVERGIEADNIDDFIEQSNLIEDFGLEVVGSRNRIRGYSNTVTSINRIANSVDASAVTDDQAAEILAAIRGTYGNTGMEQDFNPTTQRFLQELANR